MTDEELNSITENIIGSAFSVSNKLGVGFLEKVYENSLLIELQKNGLNVEQQKAINVYYDNILVGEYFSDLLVEDSIIVELKAVKRLDEIHQSQLMNYLKACKKRFGLILNFGTPKVEVKRIVNGY